jgi:hypothetical protein
MAFLTYNEFKTLDYVGFGEPFFRFEISGVLNTATLDYVGFGEPFVSNSGAPAAITSSILKFNGIAQANIGKVDPTTNANIKTLNTVSNV